MASQKDISLHRQLAQAATEPTTRDAEHLNSPLARSNLTKSQYLIWAGQTLNPQVPLYNMALAFTIEGVLDHDAFEQAFDGLVRESDALNTTFFEHEGIPQQRATPPASGRLERIDFSIRRDPLKTARAWMQRRCERCFDLDACLYDSALITLGPERSLWYFNQHHLITDAWATAVLYRRMAQLYDATTNADAGGDAVLAPYQDYADHERAFRTSSAYANSVAHWQAQAQRDGEVVRFYGKRHLHKTPRTARVSYRLGRDRTQALKAIAQAKGVRALTPHLSQFNIFSTILFAYLHRAGGTRSISIATPAHNRPTPAFKETPGLFIELFPLHADIDENERLSSLLKKVSSETLSFLRYAQPGTSDPSYCRFANVVLNYINASFSDFGLMPMNAEWLHPRCGDSNHSLRLQVHDFDESGEFVLHFDFNCDQFSKAERSSAVQHFVSMIDAFLEDRDQVINAIGLVSDESVSHIVSSGETTARAPQRSVIELFEEQVLATPEDIALAFDGKTMTYREFNARANRLARYLQRQRVGPGCVVGVVMRRCPDAVVAIYGILKAGATYVPIDPNYPSERTAFMIHDSTAEIVVTQSQFAERVAAGAVRVICVDAEWSTIAGESGDNLAVEVAADHVAYVMYTSGSTGTPKGVMVNHRGLVNYLWWAKARYMQDRAQDFPLFSSLSFDLTVTSLFLPLLCGGRLVVYGEDEAMDLAIMKVIDDNQVDVIKLTPSHLTVIQDLDLQESRIHTLIVGGEDFKTELARRMDVALGGRAAIYNEYGPTEATVGCMIHQFDPQHDAAPSVPIGRPAANMQIYLLDAGHNPVPQGMQGEIFIAGHGLATGYWNQSELTADRFVPNPFEPGERMYRSGDQARVDASGVLEFLGRGDRQVKIRGVRIELAEIENALSSHASIQNCVVDVVSAGPSFNAHDPTEFCVTCGLPSTHPDAAFDADGLCAMCRAFKKYRNQAMAYFKTMDDLRSIFDQHKLTNTADYDCLMLLSGGKDSTYVLYQLVHMGLRVLVFTMDNGFISEGAKANMRRVTDALGVELVVGQTPAMNDVFVDSLQRFSNVCNGCFKAIYTLSMNLARERGIRHIVTGLSRGQVFETRLMELFKSRVFDPDEVDRLIIEARKAYHRIDDTVSRCMDVKMFSKDSTFEEIQFVDFYRYCDAPLDDIYAFLDEHAPWVRPDDTGRSTNCLINAAGIYVHTRERGFHNYAMPYSWDVRLGHKERDAAMQELDDRIDEAEVQQMLREVGYKPGSAAGATADRLVAYFTAGVTLPPSVVESHVTQRLPNYMVPTHFVQLEEMPLTPNGKVDHAALPHPHSGGRGDSATYEAPRSLAEKKLAVIWADLLRMERVGVHDDFIECGGDSILGIQAVTRARQVGLHFTPKQLFDCPTIAQLAAVASSAAVRQAPQTQPAGPVGLTPIQHRFFDQHAVNPNHFNQTVMLELQGAANGAALQGALEACRTHHDALRLRFVKGESGWQQSVGQAEPLKLVRCEVSAVQDDQRQAVMDAATATANASLSIAEGRLMAAVLFSCGGAGKDQLLIVIHHLAVDGVSWWILLEDIQTAYDRILRGEAVALADQTSSWCQWAGRLIQHGQSEAVRNGLDYWCGVPGDDCQLPLDQTEPHVDKESSSQTLSVTLDPRNTGRLLHDAPTAYQTRAEELLLTATVMALGAYAGSSVLRVDIEGHGREEIMDGIDVSRTVGWFTSIYPLSLRWPAGCNHGTALKSIKEQLRGVPDKGVGYGLLRYVNADPKVRSRMTSLPPAQVLFNYLGRFDRLRSPLFRPGRLGLSSGQRVSSRYLLEVNAVVSDDQLHVDWTYSSSAFQCATVQRIADQQTRGLITLLDHCLSGEGTGHTPSDFPIAGLDEAKLNRLSDLLDKADGE